MPPVCLCFVVPFKVAHFNYVWYGYGANTKEGKAYMEAAHEARTSLLAFLPALHRCQEGCAASENSRLRTIEEQ